MRRLRKLSSDARRKRAERLAARRRRRAAGRMPTAATATATQADVEEARRQERASDRPTPPEKPPTTPKIELGDSGTPTAPQGDRRTSTAAIVGEESTEVPKAKDNPKNVAEGQKRAEEQGKKVGTFVGKDGRKKAAVTKEELEESGLSLRDYLNKLEGKTRRKDMKKGGAVKKTTKAKASKPKVRGAGIARKGVRPCKMR